jgi:hypothetical protein
MRDINKIVDAEIGADFRPADASAFDGYTLKVLKSKEIRTGIMWNGTIFKDGTPVAHVSQEGRGGPNKYGPIDRTLWEKLNIDSKRAYPKDPEDLDSFVMVLDAASLYDDAKENKKEMNHIKLFETFVNESTFKPGDKVKVSGGSGVASDKIATVVDRSKIKTDGRGIPTNVEGAYKPVDWSKEVAIQFDDSGDFGTMFKNRLFKKGEFGFKEANEKETGAYAAPKFARKPAPGDTGYAMVAKEFGATPGPKKKNKNSRTEESK